VRHFLIVHAATHPLYLRGLDFAPVDSASLKDDVPIVIVQHGLSGGIRNNFLFEMLNLVCGVRFV
jgi:predicted alpha/beta-fold hydrolase